MKKLGKKLSVRRQTLRTMTASDLAAAPGGLRDGAGVCSYRASGCSTFDDSTCCSEITFDPQCY